ncbi:MAG: pentapeptide repeat-containing protein, partial [Candidatus Heimdallarchaeota archaeon]|nr:pentapeptide repeat-containing protein [Candidatus Heimdallarchaeota archaeon]
MVDENSKVILTSRKEYFRWAKESEKILGGEEFGRRTILLSPPKFEVLYIEPFSREQIKKVIMLRMGDKEGVVVANKIFKTQNLAEMARKPILIELLLAVLEEVSGDILENQAKVYLYATNKLLLRNIETKRTFTTTADKLYFLCELAWEMINSGELRIHYTEIPERIETYFGDRIKGKHKLDNWDFDLRNQTLLHRDAAGYYEFAHKSLAEYFVAFKFAAELGCLAQLFMQTYSEDEEKSCTIPIEKKEITELAKTFGTIALADERMHAVLVLLHEMLYKDAAKRLWEVIWETRGKTVEQIKYVGGNAATLLKTKGESFKGANMANTLLEHADLRGCQLSSANLNGCDLSGVDLTGSMFSIENLKYAKLNKTKICIIGGGKIDFVSKQIPNEEDYLEKIMHDISSQLKTIMPGLWQTTWMPEGEYSFVIRDEINDYISWHNSYILNREKMLQIPEIQFIAVFDNEIEEINAFLPE